MLKHKVPAGLSDWAVGLGGNYKKLLDEAGALKTRLPPAQRIIPSNMMTPKQWRCCDVKSTPKIFMTK